MKLEFEAVPSRGVPRSGRRGVEIGALSRVKTILRKSLQSFVPAHFKDPLGLAIRLVRDPEPAALYSIQLAAVGILLTPLDLLLRPAEQRLYRQASEPKLPVIFVCGPPRSGTTLVTQVLVNNLPVSYLNNLSAVFPRSPIVASLMLDGAIERGEIEYKSFYGRTVHLSGHNDGLQIWDRWFGGDRTRVPRALTDDQRSGMLGFFGAHQEAFGKPLVVKNNSLNTCAHLVAGVIKNAHFICLKRDPLYLAQSLLKARMDLHGDLGTWYGVEDPEVSAVNRVDFIQDVCEQVAFHQRKIREQLDLIGPERFWVVAYEEFCEDPGALVRRVSERILGEPFRPDRLLAVDKRFTVSNRVRIEPELFERMVSTLSGLQSVLLEW